MNPKLFTKEIRLRLDISLACKQIVNYTSNLVCRTFELPNISDRGTLFIFNSTTIILKLNTLRMK